MRDAEKQEEFFENGHFGEGGETLARTRVDVPDRPTLPACGGCSYSRFTVVLGSGDLMEARSS
jgi:hypothetical protein